MKHQRKALPLKRPKSLVRAKNCLVLKYNLSIFILVDMSKAEMYSYIETQRLKIKELTFKNEELKKDKESMIDNFKLSSSVLLERLKELDVQTSFGERP